MFVELLSWSLVWDCIRLWWSCCCKDTGFLTLTLVGCDGQCVWYPYSAVTSLGPGVPVVGCRQVLLFTFWEVSRMSMVVWDSTGLICKVNSLFE